VAANYIDESLIVKRGGHSDQLSAKPFLDEYRIRSLVKILFLGELSTNQRVAAMTILSLKCAIYAKGCRKHGRLTEAACYDRLPKATQLRDNNHESATY